MTARGFDLRFERLLPAPRPLVFAAFTDAALLRRWLCPTDFRVAEAEADPEVGGRFRVVMTGPDGATYPASGEYLAVRAPELLEFTWTWENAHTMAGVATRIRVELAERTGGTWLVMTHSGLPSETERESHRGGWSGALTHLTLLMREETERWTA